MSLYSEFIEELSLNHWQPLSTLLYDGWVLRFANGYTKRANSVSPLRGSSIDLSRKIEHCERIYGEQELPVIFKLTAFAEPPELDETLEKRGYSRIDETVVQTLELNRIAMPSHSSVLIFDTPTSEWLNAFCAFNHVNPEQRMTLERMLANIRAQTGFIALYQDNRIVACGFGAIERGWIGLYDIVTDERFRNRGFGEQMILHLLQWQSERCRIRVFSRRRG